MMMRVRAPHLAAFYWFIIIGFGGAVVLGVNAIAVPHLFEGPGSFITRDLMFTAAIFLFGLGLNATFFAIALAGVRHYLNGMLRIQRDERAAERDATATAGQH